MTTHRPEGEIVLLELILKYSQCDICNDRATQTLLSPGTEAGREGEINPLPSHLLPVPIGCIHKPQGKDIQGIQSPWQYITLHTNSFMIDPSEEWHRFQA